MTTSFHSFPVPSPKREDKRAEVGQEETQIDQTEEKKDPHRDKKGGGKDLAELPGERKGDICQKGRKRGRWEQSIGSNIL